jgi:hypothetical protein
VLQFENERFTLITKFDMETNVTTTKNPQHDAKLPVMGSAKRYKRRPKHRFWKDGKGVVIKITSAGGDMNLFEWKENGQKRGCYVIGINVQADWYKISEDDFNTTPPLHCP